MVKQKIRFFFPASTMNNQIFKNLIIFTSIPIILISIFFCFYTYQKYKGEYLDTIGIQLNESKNLIDEILVKYIDKSSYIITNQKLIKNLQKNYGNDLEQMIYFFEDTDAMIGEPYYEDIKSPFIIHAANETLYDGKFVDKLTNIPSNDSIEEAKNSPATDIIWKSDLTVKDNQSYLTFYRNIVDFKTSIGILEVNIPYNVVALKMDTIGVPDTGLILSANKDGNILHLNNQTRLEIPNLKSITPKDYLIVSDSLKDGNQIIVAIPKMEVNKKTFRTIMLVVGFFLIYIFVMLLASKTTAHRITGNLESFINKIKRNDQLLLNEELIQISGTDDVSIIKLKLKELVSRLNEIHKEVVAVKLEKSSLEIELLQSRINPHLLYNSLSVINWTALRNKDGKTVEIIDAMTKYYRIALSKGNSVISVASELEMIKEYVKINVLAHSVDYLLVLDIEEEILGFYTSKHLIQPIVENAILHGLNGKRENAIVMIKGYRDLRDIVFEISDNGRGMRPESVNDIMNLNFTASLGGYGIKNVIKRIQAYYGYNDGIAIESEVGKGTKVTIRIEALNEAELNERREFRTFDAS
ncbi:sensor histidine kinase [Cohnella silvisoli]|uniref:Histidine kinase n=1 Tax=Cohnella silvisoli TaxID=2873699 RepID=A0ABV1KY07_9BACL|nr:histidine kinase [Cohnella silvisoli]MCD9023857.1 histidine kinase [Cohnella silvisoli]